MLLGTLRNRLSELGLTASDLASDMFVAQEVLLPFMDVADIPGQITQILDGIEGQLEEIAAFYVRALQLADGELSGKSIRLVRFSSNQDLWKHVPDSKQISLSCVMHNQILMRSQRLLRDLGIKTEIIEFSSPGYAQWLGQVQVPDSPVAVARWATEQQ